MKTFTDYIAMREMAAYDQDSLDAKNAFKQELDPQSEASMQAARESIMSIMDSRPDMIIAFLNHHRTDPDIKKILMKHNLESFVDPKKIAKQDYKEKGLGDYEGEQNTVHPNAADAITV